MATNAEAVGRLLANSALMQGERELMRKPNDHAATATKPASAPTAEPIVNNSKSVEAVLLTLLDEQLHATETTFAAQPKTVADGEAAASKRLAARYTADGLMMPGSESASPDIPLAHDGLRLRDVPIAISADLQSFVQRSAAMAASQSLDAVQKGANGAARGGRKSLSAVLNGTAALRMIGIGAGLAWLIALALHWGAP